MKYLVTLLLTAFTHQSFAIFNTIMLEDEIAYKACAKTVVMKAWNDSAIKKVCLFSFNNQSHGLYAMVTTDKDSWVYQIKKSEGIADAENEVYKTTGDFIYVGNFDGVFYPDKDPAKVSDYTLSNRGDGPKSYRAIELDTDLFTATDFVSQSFWIR